MRNCANADVNMEKRPSDRLRLRLRHSMQGSTRTSYDRRVDDELMKFNIEDVISYVLNNRWIRLFASDREWLKKAHEISRCRKYFRFAVCKIRAFVHCFQPKNIKDFSIHNIKFGKKSTAKHSVNSNKTREQKQSHWTVCTTVQRKMGLKTIRMFQVTTRRRK